MIHTACIIKGLQNLVIRLKYGCVQSESTRYPMKLGRIYVCLPRSQPHIYILYSIRNQACIAVIRQAMLSFYKCMLTVMSTL